MPRILLIEDHESIREGLAAYLRQDGHEVQTRADGVGLESLALPFDLFVLDVMLPGKDGFALAALIRRRTEAPFLFLSARGTEADRIAGLEHGASDYVTKPFSPKEVVLRVRAILARRPISEPVIAFVQGPHRLRLDGSAHRAYADGLELDLTPGEWSFLLALLERPGVALSRRDLMSHALEYYVDTGERTVDTHVKNLRAKLGTGAWIETVRGVGYRFAGEPS